MLFYLSVPFTFETEVKDKVKMNAATFGDIEKLVHETSDIKKLFLDKSCFPEKIDEEFLNVKLPYYIEKLGKYVKSMSPDDDQLECLAICKTIAGEMNSPTVWSKAPLPSTMFYTACLSILWSIPEFRCRVVPRVAISREEFIEKYPEFESVPDEEREKLYYFRNTLVLSFVVVKAYRNKGLIIDLVPRLSESKVYTLGGGIGPPTKRRVLIYEREGKIPKRQQPIRFDHMLRLLSDPMDDDVPAPPSYAQYSGKGSGGSANMSANEHDLCTKPTDTTLGAKQNGNVNEFHDFFDDNFGTFDLGLDVEDVSSGDMHNYFAHYDIPIPDSVDPINNDGASLIAGNEVAGSLPPKPPPITEPNTKLKEHSPNHAKVVEFVSERPSEGVIMRAVSIRNKDNQELARHAGLYQMTFDGMNEGHSASNDPSDSMTYSVSAGSFTNSTSSGSKTHIHDLLSAADNGYIAEGCVREVHDATRDSEYYNGRLAMVGQNPNEGVADNELINQFSAMGQCSNADNSSSDHIPPSQPASRSQSNSRSRVVSDSSNVGFYLDVEDGAGVRGSESSLLDDFMYGAMDSALEGGLDSPLPSSTSFGSNIFQMAAIANSNSNSRTNSGAYEGRTSSGYRNSMYGCNRPSSGAFASTLSMLGNASATSAAAGQLCGIDSLGSGLNTMQPPRTVKMSRKISKCYSTDEMHMVQHVESVLASQPSVLNGEVGERCRTSSAGSRASTCDRPSFTLGGDYRVRISSSDIPTGTTKKYKFISGFM